MLRPKAWAFLLAAFEAGLDFRRSRRRMRRAVLSRNVNLHAFSFVVYGFSGR
jgi:hypothetical protein